MRSELLCTLVALTAQNAHSWSFYDTNLTNYKTNLCERSEAVVNGSIEIEDALRGVALTFAAADYDPDWFGVGEDGVQSGFHVGLMDAMAKRAGFAYTIKAIPLDTFAGMSWTDYLDISTTVFDANLDWWLQTNTRSKMGLRCPFTFLDLSLSASMMMNEDHPEFWETFWKFASPFTEELWGIFLACSIATTVAYWIIEIQTNQEDLDPDKGFLSHGAHLVYLSLGSFTGAAGMSPSSMAGRVVVLSYSFLILVLISGYTASLATSLIVAASSSGYSDLQAAIDAGEGVCLYNGTASYEWFMGAFPSSRKQAVPVGGPGVNFLKADSAGCGVAVSSELMYEFGATSETVNPDCALGKVGSGYLEIFGGGWMTQVDYHDYCTSVLTDAFAYHLIELQMDGTIPTLVAELKAAKMTRNAVCGSADALDDSSSALAFLDMRGVFLLHAFAVFLALLVCFAYRLRDYYFPDPNRAEDEDERPATKTDMEHMMTAAAKQRAEDAALAAQQRLESAAEATEQRNEMMRLLEGISNKLNATSALPVIPDLPSTGLFGLTYGEASRGNGFRAVPVDQEENDKNLAIVKSHLAVDNEEISTSFLDCNGRLEA